MMHGVGTAASRRANGAPDGLSTGCQALCAVPTSGGSVWVLTASKLADGPPLIRGPVMPGQKRRPRVPGGVRVRELIILKSRMRLDEPYR